MAKPVVPAGTGVIRGVVHYQGPPVNPKVIGTACCPGAPPVMDQSVTVGPAGGLANVVVWIEDGPNIPPLTGADAVLTQVNCEYQPHVMAIQSGRRLAVTSHDPTVHNVNYQGENTPGDNFSEMPNSAAHVLTFNSPDLIRFKCDVHPWMSAYVRVFDHPCFAMTGPDGSFTINRLPPGTYKLCAWHERFGQLSGTVVVKDAAPAAVDFLNYKP